MAATWEINNVRFVNRARREVAVTATRTDGTTSVQYTLGSFIVKKGGSIDDEADRLVADLHKIYLADRSWSQPELGAMFPNAAAVLKTKLDALEAN